MRLIDADALCKVLEERITFRKGVVNNIEIENQCDKEVLDIGKCMPTVDAELIRHGHWIPINPDVRGYADSFECSVCGMYARDSIGRKELDYEYCPNCGAKMDEVVDAGDENT